MLHGIFPGRLIYITSWPGADVVLPLRTSIYKNGCLYVYVITLIYYNINYNYIIINIIIIIIIIIYYNLYYKMGKLEH